MGRRGGEGESERKRERARERERARAHLLFFHSTDDMLATRDLPKHHMQAIKMRRFGKGEEKLRFKRDYIYIYI